MKHKGEDLLRSLEETVNHYRAHNDREEARLIADGKMPDRASFPPPADDWVNQLKSVIASTERRVSRMTPDTKIEVLRILSELKAILPPV